MADVNELAVAGYWFYGGANAGETASLYCSYGLLETAPTPAVGTSMLMKMLNWFGMFRGGKR